MQSNSRHAVAAGFLGWTLDAFDFFVVVFLLDTLAAQFGVPKSQIIITLTATLALPSGRRDHLRHAGRPLRPPHPADGERHLLLADRAALRLLDDLHAVPRSCARCSASGWEGSGASARRWRWRTRRGNGAACSPASCRAATRSATCSRRSRRARVLPHLGWRWMFWLGALPALLALYIRHEGAGVGGVEGASRRQLRRDVRAPCADTRRGFALPRPADDVHDVPLARDAGSLSRFPQARARHRRRRRCRTWRCSTTSAR